MRVETGDPMLPPKPSKPTKVNTSLRIEESTLLRIEAIANSEEEVKSKNQLIGSFLEFSADLFPLLKGIRSQVEAFAEKEGCTYAEAIAALVERGLKKK